MTPRMTQWNLQKCPCTLCRDMLAQSSLPVQFIQPFSSHPLPGPDGLSVVSNNAMTEVLCRLEKIRGRENKRGKEYGSTVHDVNPDEFCKHRQFVQNAGTQKLADSSPTDETATTSLNYRFWADLKFKIYQARVKSRFARLTWPLCHLTKRRISRQSQYAPIWNDHNVSKLQNLDDSRVGKTRHDKPLMQCR